ncbi:ABC transporter permease subunit [Radiobacillus kanasensis]|uniref:ABC transporter permease n=1 Tax=Radiobacillus kanasensis TaxID=2844358 RepID=UPI001E5D9B49|nr:ABC transporter permease subunit [Radiobacillus kanasensis]UFT98636.1 ABC transporter permease subunit [Radiobacillus kanasensis]
MWLNNKHLLYLLPAVSVVFFLFIGGFIEGFIQSMGYFPAAGEREFSFHYYQKILFSQDFWDSLLLTLRIAFLSSVFAGILGMVVCVCLFFLSLSSKKKHNQFWQKFFQLPMAVPPLVTAFLIVLLLGQSGWISRIFGSFEWVDQINQFPILTNDSFGWGIIIAYTWKEAAFIALMLQPMLSRIHGSWLDVSKVFGCGKWSFFREIMFPLLIPAWTSATFIVFAFTFSAFEVPFLLGVTYPKMLPVLSYSLYTSGGLEARPEALAINVILVFLVILIGLIAYRLSKRWYTNEQGGW